MFPPSAPELAVLGIVAVIVLGPERVPQVAAELGRALRRLRGLADDAKEQLRNDLGTDVDELRRLDPRHLIREQLYGDPAAAGRATAPWVPAAHVDAGSLAGSTPPYDTEAT